MDLIMCEMDLDRNDIHMNKLVRPGKSTPDVCVKSLRPSYTGLYPQTGVTLHTGLYPQMLLLLLRTKPASCCV